MQVCLCKLKRLASIRLARTNVHMYKDKSADKRRLNFRGMFYAGYY